MCTHADRCVFLIYSYFAKHHDSLSKPLISYKAGVFQTEYIVRDLYNNINEYASIQRYLVPSENIQHKNNGLIIKINNISELTILDIDKNQWSIQIQVDNEWTTNKEFFHHYTGTIFYNPETDDKDYYLFTNENEKFGITGLHNINDENTFKKVIDLNTKKSRS